MAKYDWNTSRNYVAFLASELAPGTRRPHHDSELTSCYHDAFLPWGHYHNSIVLFYHDSPITRSHFMDPTDCVIKGFYCIWRIFEDWQGNVFFAYNRFCHSFDGFYPAYDDELRVLVVKNDQRACRTMALVFTWTLIFWSMWHQILSK